MTARRNSANWVEHPLQKSILKRFEESSGAPCKEVLGVAKSWDVQGSSCTFKHSLLLGRAEGALHVQASKVMNVQKTPCTV